MGCAAIWQYDGGRRRCTISTDIQRLEARLNSFDYHDRIAALQELAGLVRRGDVQPAPQVGVVNMHCHTFFSYNAYGHSPVSLAWLAKKNGFAAIGIVDFDVLDGVDEFLSACELLGVRGSAGMETRVFIPEFATREINSPGEPGIYYHMGIGFTSSQPPVEVAPILASMRTRAARRNREMLGRLNAHLAPLEVHYESDVLPLTPAGSATERHMLEAIIRTADRRFPDADRRIKFWAERTDLEEKRIADAISDYAKFSNLLRTRLMKKGGVGYVQPSAHSFPTVGEFHQLIVACGAVPCATWLDGMSDGEQAIEELLALLVGKGAAALNIIPDRNWNVPDPELRYAKVKKLQEIVRLAGELDLPLNVGTEMNSPGNRLADDFSVPVMAPLTGAFFAGAYFIYGHTVMQRVRGLGYQSEWARTHLPTRRARNAFYQTVGRRGDPGEGHVHRLFDLPTSPTPDVVLGALAYDH